MRTGPESRQPGRYRRPGYHRAASSIARDREIISSAPLERRTIKRTNCSVEPFRDIFPGDSLAIFLASGHNLQLEQGGIRVAERHTRAEDDSLGAQVPDQKAQFVVEHGGQPGDL